MDKGVDLFDKSPRDDDKNKNSDSESADGNGVVTLNLYDYSEDVAEGERVDFFISHAWDDDAKAKMDVIRRVADNYNASHPKKGGPTFWFDRVCIDQKKINDGLRVLPCNIMACDKMLILCGPEYSTRLWCMWEMCTLFALFEYFMDQLVLEPVVSATAGATLTAGHEADVENPLVATSKPDHVTDVGHSVPSDPVEECLKALAKFRVGDARCYDPNEQRKIMSVIDDVGVSLFEGCIHEMANGKLEDLRAMQEVHKKQSEVSGVGSIFGFGL